MFHVIGTIVIGIIVGLIAKLIMPDKENRGIIMTRILGIVGSLAATFAGRTVGWYQERRLDGLDYRRFYRSVGRAEG
jgi:uncharacterized membrane protein YeaQ/YmgE (transglycosylase-associated protein family)